MLNLDKFVKINIRKMKVAQLFFISVVFILQANTALGNTVNIIKSFFYTENNVSYLILQENIFKLSMSEYEQGRKHSEGYNIGRISVYDLETGKLITQQETGVMDSAEACILLGCSQGNLWLYSNKYKSGLQSLNPVTLRRNISQAKIYSLLDKSIGRFLEPAWGNIEDNYGYNPILKKLIVTTNEHKRFYIDVNTFKTEPVQDEIILNPVYSNYFSNKIDYNGVECRLSGYENKMNILCERYSAPKNVFLSGAFILQQNRSKLYNFYKSKAELSKNAEDVKNAKENVVALIKGEKPDDILLQSDSNSFFIMSKSDNSDDAFIRITKIGLLNDKLNIDWATDLKGMFFNIAKARHTKTFKKYFGDFVPDFDYQLFQVSDDKLVVIFQQYIECVDINSGDILWYKKINCND